MNIRAYTNHITCAPGDDIQTMVSTESPQFSASLIRLTAGRTEQQPFSYETILADIGTFPGRVQPIHPGSYVRFALAGEHFAAGALTFQCWLWATLPAAGRSQCVATFADVLRLCIDPAGHLELHAGGAVCRAEQPLEGRTWYFIACRWSAHLLELHLRAAGGMSPQHHREFVATAPAAAVPAGLQTLTLAADHQQPPAQHYNGKIDSPCLFARLLSPEELDRLEGGAVVDPASALHLVGQWDFNHDLAGDDVQDTSGSGSHGKLYQSPMRGVTGHRWNGTAQKPGDNPRHYNAVHFHEDDLDDAGWERDFSLKLPADLRSGVYALHLKAANGADSVPFFVRAPAEVSGDVLYLAPTYTYLAYANEHLAEIGLDDMMAHPTVLNANDRYLFEHPELGRSIYDTHSDGSGVAYSSRLRPVVNLRPDYHTWLNNGARHFAADLYITGWLERSAPGYHVATDDDLHREGLALLNRYKVLVTGSHPEYWTRAMMEALHGWLRNGGRLLYLGGNGFYWVTGTTRDKPHRIEVRRGVAGTRSWDSQPGELYLSTTGDLGGLWRHAGYVPQAVVGVGFTAEGWGGACGYRRLEASYSGKYAALFDGIDGDIIGDFGYIMGGAVGDEVDRLDYALGTPGQAHWLATSTGLNNYYRFVHEDLLYSAPNTGGAENPLVRADMVILDIGGGGAVFSVGSINYAGALAWNNYDNSLRQLTDNVLQNFLAERTGA